MMFEAESLKILAIVRSPAVGEALASAVTPINGAKVDVRIGELKEIGLKAAQEESPDLLFVELDADDPEDVAALDRITKRPSGSKVPVIATAATISPSALSRLLRDGVDDFIPQPMSEADVLEVLRSVLAKTREQQSPTEKRGAIISFLRCSGGMGATTLAVHTAFSLMRQHSSEQAKVCLLDLDLQFGNAALYLDLESGSGILDIIRTPARLDGSLLRGAMVQHTSGLHVLTAPPIPIPLEALRSDSLAQLLEQAKQEYAYVVVDLPHALTSWTDAILGASDMIALVVQLTVPALRQAHRLVELFKEEGHYSLPLAIVVNRHVRRWGEKIDLRQAEKALGRPVAYVIPNDFELVSGALNRGVPAYEIKSRSKFGKEIHALAQSAVQRIRDRRLATVQPTAS